MEKRSASVPFELKSFDAETREFTGLASTWDVDLDGERFEQGAWTQTAKHFRSAAQREASDRPLTVEEAQAARIPVKVGHEHRPEKTIGKIIEMEETKRGLFVRAKLATTSLADDIFTLIRGGYLGALSVGFDALKTKMETRKINGTQRDIRVITEAKLMEVSVVDWGANPFAMIGAKSLIREEKGRESMREFRDQLDELLEEKAETNPAETPPEPEPIEPQPKPEPSTPAPEPQPAEEPAEHKEPDANPALVEMEAQVADLEEKKSFAISIEDYIQANRLKGEIATIQSQINKYRQVLGSMKSTDIDDPWSPFGKLRLQKEAELAALLAEDGELVKTA